MLDEQRNFRADHGPSNPNTVHVVEDDTDLRLAALRILRGAGVAAQAYECAADFLHVAPSLPAGCVLTDYSMPGMNGLELIGRIAAERLPFTSILVTGHGNVQLAVEAMRAGATDFIEKPFAPEALLLAVRRALDQRTGSPVAAEATALSMLTSRERQVLERLLGGRTNKLIARELGISPRTVEAYRAALMRKAGAASAAELVRISVLAGVAPAPDGTASRPSLTGGRASLPSSTGHR